MPLRLTYGYCRVQKFLVEAGFHVADTVIRKLMDQLGVQVSLYNRQKMENILNIKVPSVQ